MDDTEEHVERTPEEGDNWVNSEGWSAQRVPGIHDVPDATYVDRSRRISRRTLIIGIAVVVLSIAVGLGFVLAANRDEDSRRNSELSAAATETTPRSDKTSTTTTTTTAVAAGGGSSPATTPSTAARSNASGSTATTKPAIVAAATPPAPAPATPRATANPALPAYQPKNVPTGVSATLTSCAWAGGQLQASGAITSKSSSAKVWTVTVVWTQNSREMARNHLLTELTPGQAKPWALGFGAPNPPADLTCYLEIS